MASGSNTGYDSNSGHPFQKLKMDYQVLHQQERELTKAGKYSEAQKLKIDNNLYRKGNLVSMVDKIERQRKKVEDSRLQDDEKQRRLANFDQRIKEAMDRAVKVIGE